MPVRAVFVHLGQRNPPHLWPNLKRHLRLFPEIPVSLVLGDKRHIRRVPPGVEILPYDRSEETNIVLRNLSRDENFRQGFWHLTLERLMALEVAHNAHVGEAMLHIESDVILMPSFPWDLFENKHLLMWGEASAVEDIAALIFSPEAGLTRKLASFTREQAAHIHDTNDMRTLRAFYDQNLDLVEKLPIEIGGRGSTDVFDVLAIGMWLGGMDPSNARGVRTYHISMPHHTVNASMYKYSVAEGQLTIESESQRALIHSLHIHSKDMRLFGPQWEKRLSQLVELANRKPHPVRRFSFAGFLSWFREFIREVTSKKFAVAVIRRLAGLLRISGSTPN